MNMSKYRNMVNSDHVQPPMVRLPLDTNVISTVHDSGGQDTSLCMSPWVPGSHAL